MLLAEVESSALLTYHPVLTWHACLVWQVIAEVAGTRGVRGASVSRALLRPVAISVPTEPHLTSVTAASEPPQPAQPNASEPTFNKHTYYDHGSGRSEFAGSMPLRELPTGVAPRTQATGREWVVRGEAAPPPPPAGPPYWAAVVQPYLRQPPQARSGVCLEAMRGVWEAMLRALVRFDPTDGAPTPDDADVGGGAACKGGLPSSHSVASADARAWVSSARAGTDTTTTSLPSAAAPLGDAARGGGGADGAANSELLSGIAWLSSLLAEAIDPLSDSSMRLAARRFVGTPTLVPALRAAVAKAAHAADGAPFTSTEDEEEELLLGDGREADDDDPMGLAGEGGACRAAHARAPPARHAPKRRNEQTCSSDAKARKRAHLHSSVGDDAGTPLGGESIGWHAGGMGGGALEALRTLRTLPITEQLERLDSVGSESLNGLDQPALTTLLAELTKCARLATKLSQKAQHAQQVTIHALATRLEEG